METDKGYTKVFVWGSNGCGQLGLGNTQSKDRYCIPKLCTFNVKIRTVSCGEEHSAFITDIGTLYTMGSNADGRLGIGDKSIKSASTPCLVEALSSSKVVEVACGMGHTMAVIDNGKAYSWGMGQYGALGINDCESQWFPVQVLFNERPSVRIKNVSCGTRHTSMVTVEGQVFVCGANDAGQLGIGTRETQLRPIRVSSLNDHITQSASGILHTLVLSVKGEVFGMGGNHLGQLGTGDKRSSKLPVLVQNLKQDKVVKVVAGKFSAAVTEEGKLLVWGTGTFGEKLLPVPLEGVEGKIRDVNVKGGFGVATDLYGKLYSWGENACGELGAGDYKQRAQAVQVESLEGKNIFEFSCGGAYVIALGSGERIPSSIETKEKVETEWIGESRLNVKKQVSSTKAYELKGPQEDYEIEHQKCNELERKINELQIKSYLAQGSELKDRVIQLEKQLITERKRCDGILKQSRGNTSLINESKIQELEGVANELKADNERMKNGGYAIGSNIRVSEVLKDYENRIEQEMKDRRVIAQEKDEEIKALSDEIARAESKIALLQNEKTRMNENYTKSVWKLKENIDNKKRVLGVKLSEKEELLEQKQREEAQKRLIEDDIARTSSYISECEDSLKYSLDKLEEARHRVLSKENDIQDTKEKQKRLINIIQDKEIEYNNYLNNYKNIESVKVQEINQLRTELNKKKNYNNELKNTLTLRVQELNVINRNIDSLLNSTEQDRIENRNLKQLIEELEERNRKSITSKEYISRFTKLDTQYRSRFNDTSYLNKVSARKYTPEIGQRDINYEKRTLSQSRHYGRVVDNMKRYEETMKDYSRLAMSDIKSEPYPTHSPGYNRFEPKESTKEIVNSTKQFIQTLRISGNPIPLSEKVKVTLIVT